MKIGTYARQILRFANVERSGWYMDSSLWLLGSCIADEATN